MKKKAILLALAMVALGVSAQDCCPKASKETKPDKKMKALVTYFSASGVTRNAARQVADIIGADLFEIVPEQIYTEADLDWRDKQSRSTIEMNDKQSRPAIKDGGKVDLTNYDVVFVGFPIWWYTAPTIINTFIEANDFTGKTIVPFATSGGSNIKKSCEDLKAAYPDYKFGEGRLLNHIDKGDVEKWAAAVK
ncbi:MAG: NAD(P)H-dependent oxidoreductase [Bacteroidales bacterium]|nr:NAD(P)H-dependent oxidoreductase [Bacteroidales bacterium]